MSNTSDPGHGNSPAAWTAVVIMLVGFAAGTLFFWFGIVWAVLACAGLVLVGAIVGGIMAKVGYGVRGPRYLPKAHD